MKQRRWYLLVVCCVVGLFISCHEMERHHQEVRSWMADNGKIKVLCTTAFVGTLAQAVGGEYVDVFTLVSSQNDPHSYQLVKGDDEKFRRAAVVFSSGLGLEQGTSLARYLASYHACAVGDAIAQRTGGAIFNGPTVDPHMWMDISLWAHGAEVVAQRLSQLRPDLSAYFQKMASETMGKLMGVHHRIHTLIQDIPPEKRYMVTTHDAFQYFCRAYCATPEERLSEEWRTRCIAPEGFSPESQISTQDLNTVVMYILRHTVKEIFSESGMNQDSLRKVVEVCEERGWPVFISCDSLYSDTMGPGMTYEEMMEQNGHAIFRVVQTSGFGEGKK